MRIEYSSNNMSILRVDTRKVRRRLQERDAITAFYAFRKDKDVILAVIAKKRYTQLASSFTFVTFISWMMAYQWSAVWNDLCLIILLRERIQNKL